jgi:two-component system, NarL family, sensor kinase
MYPPGPPTAGLIRALHDLVGPLTGRGIAVDLRLPESVDLSRSVEAALFRVAQEVIRNVVTHADAQHVRVSLVVDTGRATLAVEDDGRGFVVLHRDRPVSATPDGRLGLALLADTLRELGGALTVDSTPGLGTVVTATAPTGPPTPP